MHICTYVGLRMDLCVQIMCVRVFESRQLVGQQHVLRNLVLPHKGVVPVVPRIWFNHMMWSIQVLVIRQLSVGPNAATPLDPRVGYTRTCRSPYNGWKSCTMSEPHSLSIRCIVLLRGYSPTAPWNWFPAEANPTGITVAYNAFEDLNRIACC